MSDSKQIDAVADLRLSRRSVLIGAGALAVTPAFAQLPEQPEQPPRLDVPYVPTPQEVVDRMLAIAKVSGKDFVMDLGCGDGRMLVTAASKFGARGRGVDLNPIRIKEATANAQSAKVTDKVTFEVKNLFETSIADADVLTMYLLPSVNLQLRPRIFDEMKPGSRIVSHSFDMGDWDADLRDQVNYSRIYYWVVPAKVAGKWIITDGADKIEADLVQTHQKITGGTVKFTGGTASVVGLITGEEVRIMTQIRGEPRIYAGRVSGNSIAPIAGGAQGWTAARG
ncbi:MAG: methyltransferase domain-containing protein [Beijerinckiaceae bacterium]|nr:methyltransferase domain-containing protein [Beijerinckiaceae bacterium]